VRTLEPQYQTGQADITFRSVKVSRRERFSQSHLGTCFDESTQNSSNEIVCDGEGDGTAKTPFLVGNQILTIS
jgi:hypothetical protein